MVMLSDVWYQFLLHPSCRPTSMKNEKNTPLEWIRQRKEKKTWILLASESFFVGQEQLKFSTEEAPQSGLETGE